LSDDYCVRFYEYGDEEKLVKLLDDVFRGWPRQDITCSKIDYWRWKHLDNPVSESIMLVTEIGEEIVGSNNSVPMNVRLGNDEFLCVIGTDLAVHREHRRKGIRTRQRIKKMERLLPRGVAYSYHMTGNPILIESGEKENLPKFPHPVAPYVIIKDIDLHISKMPVDDAWLKKLGYRTLEALNKIENQLVTIPKNEDIFIEKIDKLGSDFDIFWDRISKQFDYIGVRNRKYINWRYCDPRAGNYSVYLAKEGDKVLGYIVVCINSFMKDYPVGFVVDLLTHPDHIEASYSLLDEALRYFTNNKINVVNSLVVKGGIFEIPFSRKGFLDSRIRLQVFMRPMSKNDIYEILSSYKPERVHFSWGDHDSLPLQTRLDS
jgi:hypothetical protein